MIELIAALLPPALLKIFPAGKLNGRETELIRTIIESKQAGIVYERALALEIINYIYERRGKEYKQLCYFTAHKLHNSSVRFYVDGVPDILTTLLVNVSEEDGRTWKYFEVPFGIFARKAVTSILSNLTKKKKPLISYGVPPDSEDYTECNITEYAPDPDGRTVEDIYSENELVTSYTEHLKIHDPQAYRILSLQLEGKNSIEIAEELNLERKDVNNGKKRLKRIAKRYYPEAKKIKVKMGLRKNKKNFKNDPVKQPAINISPMQEFLN